MYVNIYAYSVLIYLKEMLHILVYALQKWLNIV